MSRPAAALPLSENPSTPAAAPEVKPVILSVDDEPEVLRAVVSDLRARYGQSYRIVRAESGAEALETLRELKRKGVPVAMFLADQRMPGMQGTEFLAEAMQLYPEARRLLLTAYADNQVAIRAINDLNLDYYLMKPWHPPEQGLFPVLDDQLYHWQHVFQPEFTGLRVIDVRWSPEGHAIRDFLSRNHVPYLRIDIETQKDNPLLATLDTSQPLPLVMLPEGEVLANPPLTALAERVGLTTEPTTPYFEVIVVGAGPSGLAAAVAAATEGMKVAVIERSAPGGQAGTSSLIENYLGFPAGISGAELSRRAIDQAKRFGAEFITNDVTGMRVAGQYKFLTLASGQEISCSALVLANGVAWNRLDIPGARELEGRGIFYGAAMTEAMTCQNREVFIIGAGNSAGQAAMLLSQHCRKVTIVCRRGNIHETMSEYLAARIETTPNISVLHFMSPVAVKGTDAVEALVLEHVDTKVRTDHSCDALFIFIGAEPHTDWLAPEIALDEKGFVITGETIRRTEHARRWTLKRDPYLTETTVPGIFAVGDVRSGSVKRVASAVGEGSITQKFVSQALRA
jgi:thioredoxin reductase (NADPH)